MAAIPDEPIPVIILRRGEPYDVAKALKNRLSVKEIENTPKVHRSDEMRVRKNEIRAVLRALGHLPPMPEEKMWR